MNWYLVAAIAVGASVSVLIAPEGLLPSVLLAYLVVAGYLAAWFRRHILLIVMVVLGLCTVGSMETPLTVNLEDTGSTGFDRFMEVGPAMLMASSIAVGYWYAWRRRLTHVVTCIFLAITSLVLGW